MQRMTTTMARAAGTTLIWAAAASAAWADVKIDAGWLRPTVKGQQAGAAYLTLQSADADRLVAVSTPAARSVELHRMAMDGNVMRMRQVDAIELPAGAAVKLEPGGLHLMLLGLKAPLRNGESVPMTLRFEKAGELTTQVKVSTSRP